MRIYLKRLFSDSIIYGLSGMVSSLIGIFLIPLYTRVFAPDDYAIIAIFTTTSILLSMIINFGLDNSAAVWFWDSDTHESRKKVFNTWVSYLAAAGLLVFLLLATFSRKISEALLDTDKFFVVVVLVGVYLALSSFQKVVNIWCRMLQKPIWAMVYSFVLLLVTVSFNILFVLKMRVGIVGIFYSQIITGTVGIVLFFLFFRKWFDLSLYSWSLLKKMAVFSAPLIPTSVLFWVMNTAVIYFLTFFEISKNEIGLYQVGNNVSNILSLAVWAFVQAYTPFALSMSRSVDAKKVYSLVFEIYCILGFTGAFLLMLYSKEVLVVFTNTQYYNAASVISILAANVILVGLPNMLSIANNIVENNRPSLYSVFFGSVVTVLCFFLLIPKFGKEGAAFSVLIGNFIATIVLAVIAQRFYPIPYSFLRIFVVIGFVFMVCLFLNLYATLMFVKVACSVLIIAAISVFYYIKLKKDGVAKTELLV